MIVYIYGLYDPRNGNLRYIGKTLNLKTRLYLHLREIRNTHKNQWLKNLKDLGLSPEMKVLQIIENSDDKDWQDIEKEWISKSLKEGHPLTNLDSGGRGGNLKCKETRMKMSEAQKARNYKHSKESKRKISESKSNPSDETRYKLRITKLGLKQSEETKNKRAESLRGQKRSDESKALMRLKRIEVATRKRLENPKPPKIYKGHKNRPPISEETRQKLRDSHKGKTQSPETIAKRVSSRIGVPRSEETKEKIRLGHLGKPKPRKNK